MARRPFSGSMVDADAVLVVFAVRVDSCAVLTLLNLLFWQPLTLHISLDPEIGEKHKEEGSIHPDEVDDQGELVVTAVHEVILSSVKRHQDKLDLLGGSRITNYKLAQHLLLYINAEEFVLLPLKH